MFDRQIRRLKLQVALVAIAGVSVFVAYQVLLDKRAKEDLKSAIGTVNESGRQLATLVNERIGTIMDEEVVAQNRKQVRDAWQALGF